MRLTPLRSVAAALLAAATLASPMLAPASPAAASPIAPTASTGTVLYWNDVLQEVFRRQGGGPGPLARAAAMMHAGIFNTFNIEDWRQRQWVGTGYEWYGALVDPSSNYGGFDYAAGKVASELLTDAFPAHSVFIQQAFVSRHGTVPPLFAQNVVDQVLPRIRALRTGDGAGDTTPYQFDNVAGGWRLSDPLCTAPINPNWGRVKPFGESPITQFVQGSPGGHASYQSLLASQLYADQLNEVKLLGRFDSTARTAEQEEIAWFWANDLDGTYKPPGQLLDYTRTAAQRKGVTDALDLARLFAHTSLALADAGIAAWYQKYETSIDLWRPQTAIRLAGTDGNPGTTADPGWLPLSADRPPSQERFSPCFPAWVSGHATFAAAWAGVLRNELGDTVSLTVDSEDPRAVGVQRTFNSFTAAAVENARSRIYLGVHYQFDADDGLATGFAVADHVTANLLSTFSCQAQPPVVCW